MKKYLFLTSALVLMLAACAKENQAPQSDSDLITVTIGATAQENSKVAIGQKDGDVYPVIWTAGDKIAVNGVASSEADIQSNPAYAKFNVTVPAAGSYTLVYPYTDGNATDEVTFAGTTLPMYAVTTNLDENVSFQALYGVLKFSVKGTATLTGIVLTTQDGSQVTGKFAIGEGGVLTGKDASATTLSVNFAAPVALDAKTPAEFFIPVPAGTYNIFDIQLVDSENTSMTKKIGGDNNYTVGAGKVKEFPAFAYEANQHLFAIKSASDLEHFASLVTEGTFAGKYEGAKVVGDFTAPEDWTSLDYTGLFDGGNKTISGLKAPLFGTLTDATVKNVKLNANMTNTSELAYGALAKTLTGSTSVVDNCSVAGTILLNLDGDQSTDTHNFAGLVGKTEAGTISNCSSTALVQMNRPGKAKIIQMGAMAGELAAGARIQGCTVTAGMVKANDGPASTTYDVEVRIAGIVGMLNAGATVEGCTLPKKTSDNGAIVSARMNVTTFKAGGIAGQGNGTIMKCTNAQDVSLGKASQKVTNAYLGGISGASEGAGISGCTNSGAVFFGHADGITVAQTVQTRMGGIVGTIKTNTTVKSCANNGEIQYSGNASKTTHFGIGGVVGYVEQGLTIDNWSNTGTIRVSPTAPALGITKTAPTGFKVGVGGLIGLEANAVYDLKCEGTNSNSGAIKIRTALAPTDVTGNNYAFVGGCIGCWRNGSTGGQTYTFTNTGDISVQSKNGEGDEATYTTDIPNVAAGGIIGHTAAGSTAKATFDGCKVRCKIANKKTGTTTGPGLLCGWAGGNKIYKNCLVAGSVNDVEITSGNFEDYLFLSAASDGGNNGIWEE